MGYRIMSYNKNFLSLSLLVMSTVACAMDDALSKSSSSSTSSAPSSSSTSQPKRSPMSFTSVGGILNTPQPEVKPKQLKDDDLFENTRVADLKIVLQTAPKRAQNIVKILQNPGNLQVGKFKYVFFVGAPGTGKTTTAQAIAYKMVTESGWGHKFMTATDIIGGFRNQAAERLRLMLDAIRANAVPMLLIIDELNKILDHSESKDHDNDTISTVLWNFLDKQNYRKFFFIGLMNDHTKIPEALKSRVTLRCIEFTELKEFDAKRDLLNKSLLSFSAQLHADVKPEAVNELLNTNPSLSARDFNEIAFRLSELSWDEHPEQTIFIITLEHLKAVFNEFSGSKAKIKRGTVVETNEERQERHHGASIDLQKQGLEMQKNHFNMQQAQQEVQQSSNQALQEKHFVMQHKLQKKAHDTQEFNYVQQLVIQDKLDSKKLTTKDLLSDEQRAIYDCLISQGMGEHIRSCDEYLYEDEIKELRAKRKKAHELLKKDRNEIWANMEKKENEEKKKEAEEAAKKASSSSSSSWFGSWS
jgi:AAA+ superfamily predicted ATPase